MTKCQSDFLPGYSCILESLSIVHDGKSSFDCDPTQDVRGIFLDISKTFDKLWQEGLLFKLKMSRVKREVFNLLCIYLHERNQKVVFSGQISSWKFIKSGVPQGLVLDPLLFLIYINGLPDSILFNCKMFADDTSLFSHVFDKYKSQSDLNDDL